MKEEAPCGNTAFPPSSEMEKRRKPKERRRKEGMFFLLKGSGSNRSVKERERERERCEEKMWMRKKWVGSHGLIVMQGERAEGDGGTDDAKTM